MTTQTLKKIKLHNQTIWHGRIEKFNGQTLIYRPRFYIRPLQNTDVKEMSILSEKIYQKLKKEEECFIHKHDQSYYEETLKNSNIHFIGVFVGTQLIGMSALYVCENAKTLTNEIPGIPDHLLQRYDNSLSGALGGDCVLPEFRGNNINQAMIAYRMELAQQIKCQQVFSIIDRNNHWNMAPYFNNQFKMFASAIDPSDNGQISLMHHHFNRQTLISGKKISVFYTQFDKIDFLLANDYIGKKYDTKTKTIIFTKEVEMHPLTRQNMTNTRCSQMIYNRLTQNKGMSYV